MDEEQHYARFDEDGEGDFENGQWIGGEFFGSKKRSRQQTKDDALYGVFADDSEDEDRKGRKGGKQEKDYIRAEASRLFRENAGLREAQAISAKVGACVRG